MSWLTPIIFWVSLAIVSIAALPVLVVSIEVLAFALAKRRKWPLAERRPRLAIVMPAHDEARGITPSIESVLAGLGPDDRLVVVADNCRDDTAEVARSAGALVVERHDPTLRGKGYALDFGLRELERDPPEVVGIVDADCLVAPGSLDRLARTARALDRPVQALYLMRSPAGAGLKMRIAELAWLVKNQVRPDGAGRLGVPCHLMGTGMVFPWETARSLDWASGHLVEDMELGVSLALRGSAPVFSPDALVESVFPEHVEGVVSQRTRWEHGHFSMIASHAPRLFFGGLARLRPSLVGFALDLAVPPLASLVLFSVVATLVGAAAFFAGAGWVPLAVSMAAWASFTCTILLAWSLVGRKVVSLGELLGVPLYVFGKVPLYLRLLGKKQVEWVRTKRNG